MPGDIPLELKPLDYDPRQTVTDLSQIDHTYWKRDGTMLVEQIGPPRVLSNINGCAYVALPLLRYGNVKGRKTRMMWTVGRWTLKHGIWRLHFEMSMSPEAVEGLVEHYLREGDELVALRDERKEWRYSRPKRAEPNPADS